MAEVIEALTVETPPQELLGNVAGHAIPLEQRTDVTVDELEKISLPYQAELYHGRVVPKMANFAHGLIQGRVFAKLNSYLGQNPLGYAITETNFKLWPNRAGESRIPDVAFVKKERLPRDWFRFPEGAPELAIEIISPEEKSEAMFDKVDEYLEQGAKMVWLFFPKKREVLVCTAANTHRVREVLTAPELLPGFELRLSEIFADMPLPDQV